ncbi:hypothetical protein A1D23_11620 [Chelonobacter oris]|uniref:hypothetical protein n=1 Tax=Chelonobacter oris TaxID=505317 RepID=UPI00244863DF|nr:hypothetical protein [Chelonobacter oris]MDH3001100.1 hypothetical protein [Chelonobacter oris]
MSNHSILHKMVWSVLSNRDSNEGEQLIALSEISLKNADSIDLSRLVTPMLSDYAHLNGVVPDSEMGRDDNLSFNVINAFADVNWILEDELLNYVTEFGGFESAPVLTDVPIGWNADEEMMLAHLQTEETVQYGWVGGMVFDDTEQSAVDLLLLASHVADEPLVFDDSAGVLSTAGLLNDYAETATVFESEVEEYRYTVVSTVLVDELERNVSLQIEIL